MVRQWDRLSRETVDAPNPGEQGQGFEQSGLVTDVVPAYGRGI